MADEDLPNGFTNPDTFNNMSPTRILTGGPLKNLPRPPEATDRIGQGDLTFPLDLENYTFHITFDFRKWMRRSVRDRTFFAAQGNLRLPVPNNMIDNNQVQWGIEGNNPIAGALIDAAAAKNLAGSTMPQSIDDFVNTSKSLLEGQGSALGSAAATTLAQSVFGNPNVGQAGALFGLAVNPFLTVVFQSPLYKRHSFSWRLSPATPAESEVLVRIHSKFRRHMFPTLTNWAGGTLLNYPDICLVTLYPQDKFLYKFKPCVVTDCVLNYAPNTPAFFNQTQAPVEMIMTINLLEVEYWIGEDVDATWNQNSIPNGEIFVPVT